MRRNHPVLVFPAKRLTAIGRGAAANGGEQRALSKLYEVYAHAVQALLFRHARAHEEPIMAKLFTIMACHADKQYDALPF